MRALVMIRKIKTWYIKLKKNLYESTISKPNRNSKVEIFGFFIFIIMYLVAGLTLLTKHETDTIRTVTDRLLAVLLFGASAIFLLLLIFMLDKNSQKHYGKNKLGILGNISFLLLCPAIILYKQASKIIKEAKQDKVIPYFPMVLPAAMISIVFTCKCIAPVISNVLAFIGIAELISVNLYVFIIVLMFSKSFFLFTSIFVRVYLWGLNKFVYRLAGITQLTAYEEKEEFDSLFKQAKISKILYYCFGTVLFVAIGGEGEFMQMLKDSFGGLTTIAALTREINFGVNDNG